MAAHSQIQTVEEGAIVTDKQFVGTVTINGGVLRIQMPEGTASLDSNEGYQSIDAETS